jgi:hypothetical protein
MKFTMDIPVGVITHGEFQTAAAVRDMALPDGWSFNI